MINTLVDVLNTNIILSGIELSLLKPNEENLDLEKLLLASMIINYDQMYSSVIIFFLLRELESQVIIQPFLKLAQSLCV